ncbi:hypothetical protein G3569_14160 [Aliifodinibius halophilus]|uniref:Transmembrane protein n=2 Tax=Fodinibius halophilus TaxID=1736908 RepID=A0A6M1T060_9BACT|nr:hypothetical protein [Fodinibius halophilus]
MIVTLHAICSTIALILILSFFISTVVVELLGDPTSIQAVKQYIVYGIGALVPAMAAAGFSGNKLSGKSKASIVQEKKKRMKRIMILGIAVLIPSAVALHLLAQSGSIGTLFYSLQLVELVAGGTNIYLLGQNMRAGLILSGRISKKARQA